MNILTTSTDPQTFKIIPRETPPAVTINITDENLRTTVTYTNNVPDYQYGSMVITESLSLIEGRFYIIEVSASSDIVYRGRIFCTNQTNYAKYQMTSGSISTSNDNDQIIYI